MTNNYFDTLFSLKMHQNVPLIPPLFYFFPHIRNIKMIQFQKLIN